jgi:hypothetical protein
MPVPCAYLEITPTPPTNALVNSNALGPEFSLRLLDLAHQFLVCVGYIVESEDAVTEFEEEVCAERHKGPEWELWHISC